MAVNINMGFVAVATGVADAITATFNPAITALTDKTLVWVRSINVNATATPTFAPNGLAAKTIVKRGLQALSVGDIQGSGHIIELVYDGTNQVWELSNPAKVTASDTIGVLLQVNNLSDVANAATARTNLGLGNVNNTSDANKPISTAQQTALDLKLNKSSVPCEFIVACSDLSTALATGTTKAYFRAPYAFTITAVRASLGTTQTSGSIFTIDINESGTSVLSTKLTIDNGEKTSTTAATPSVISDSAIADDAEITIDIDQVGDGTAKGLIVALIGTHSV